MERVYFTRLRYLLTQFPSVAILGPRQAGKTTLSKTTFPDLQYFDLENPRDLSRFRDDPLFALESAPKVVVDEAQRLPELFPALRSFLDSHKRSKVVLLGSASPSLLKSISESLAGRIGFLELAGVSVFEEKNHDALWIKGGYPRTHWGKPKAKPDEWYPPYVKTYLEQDIPQLGFQVSPLKMRNLLSMIAHSQGGVCNLSELGGSLGIGYHTVSHLLDIFEGTFWVRRLAPFSANLGKRLVKSPKVYLRDTGLLHHLLGIEFTKKALLGHPKAGASFETFCIEQLISHAKLADPSSEACFFRTHAGAEVDLLLKLKGKWIPIEIKMSTVPQNLKSLEICMSDLGLSKGYLLNLSQKLTPLKPKIQMGGLVSILDDLGLRPR